MYVSMYVCMYVCVCVCMCGKDNFLMVTNLDDRNGCEVSSWWLLHLSCNLRNISMNVCKQYKNRGEQAI